MAAGGISQGSGLVESTNGRGVILRTGVHVTVAADDALTPLDLGFHKDAELLGVTVSLESDPDGDPDSVTAVVNAAGTAVNIKSWKPTGTADTAVIAATAFAANVRWIALAK